MNVDERILERAEGFPLPTPGHQSQITSVLDTSARTLPDRSADTAAQVAAGNTAESCSVLPSTTLRRASITFKLKNYNEHQESAAAPDPSGLLGPYWTGARMSRASSPALSVQSEASDRGPSSKGNGTRPATFLFTLTSFLRENPNSPYMRWSENGTYFIVPDKAGLMDRVIPELFNQNSYSSFARQLNIYGWRRLQSSPDGKTVSSNCTIWKHDQITRDTPDEDLKHVKRNAQDKSRRNSKSMDDEVEEYEVTTRPRRAITMSSTTAAEAMAVRKAAGASTNLRYSSTSFDSGTTSAESTSSPPQIPSVLAPIPTRANGPSPASILQASQPPTFTQGRLSRPLPMRRPPSRSFSYSGRTLAKRTREATPETAASSPSSSNDTESDEAFPAVFTNSESANAISVADETRSNKRVRHEVESSANTQQVAHRTSTNDEHPLRVLPFQLAASRQVIPQNPVDVYVACVDSVNGGPPTFKGRDRIDISIWVDNFSQARFVLAGEMMRAWALWDVVPGNALIYIALSDASKPPRPLGIAQQLKENTVNGDPNRAYSRERIYLETSGEPGSVGQCCLLYRKSVAQGREGDGQKMNDISTTISAAPILFKEASGIQQWNGSPVSPTPKVQPQAPTSSERRPLLCETRSGRKLSDRFLDSPALPSPAMRTPKTADAISSLAAMQAFARSFTPSKEMDNKSPSSSSMEFAVPRSTTDVDNIETKPVISTDPRMTPIHAGGSS